ncbi:TetR/AcrR family transcriptional regulator [Sporolactobacillus sp. KGMB 08714]|uniref:TetR/AcrR family transcriptional regulator n=1 Tax=Sporolactobacillus sp. KGMB 08714 TaxID=3064704 RepID=UPI002FBEF320
MIQKFLSLEPEKQTRIINAALAEFSERGYKNASTNEIVKRANISKGLLFHYFGSKKKLFLFLYDYSMNLFLNDFYSKIDFSETDLIKKLRQAALLKIELIQKHPDLYNFILTSMVDDSFEIKPELEDKFKAIAREGYSRLFANIDVSKLKEGLDVRHVTEIIMWVGQGFGNRVLEQMKRDPDYKRDLDIQKFITEYDTYIAILKNAFYK